MKLEPITLPRQLAPGLFWLGGCQEQPYFKRVYHSTNSTFLVSGTHSSILVEGGHPRDFVTLLDQLKTVLARPDVAPLKYVFVTHQETPHSTGMAQIMQRYPDVVTVGDMADYHLVFPMFEHRLRWMKCGDRIDLGGRELVAVEPVVRDLATTLWGFDTGSGMLFPGDGFCFSHYHDDGHCGHLGEEATTIDFPETSAIFAEFALFWTKFCDMQPYIERLEQQVRELGVKAVGSTHGLPVMDLTKCFEQIKSGLAYGSQKKEMGTPIGGGTYTSGAPART